MPCQQFSLLRQELKQPCEQTLCAVGWWVGWLVGWLLDQSAGWLLDQRANLRAFSRDQALPPKPTLPHQ